MVGLVLLAATFVSQVCMHGACVHVCVLGYVCVCVLVYVCVCVLMCENIHVI